MKKIIIIVLCILSCFLFACNKKQEDPVDEKETFNPSLDVEKEVVLKVYGGWENFEALDAVETAFKEYYPNVSINYTYTSNFATTLSNMAPNGDIDLFFNTKSSNAWAEGDCGPLYRQYMVDLNTLNLNLNNINASAVAVGKDGDKLLGIPFLSDFFGFIVNEDLLKENGFDVPESYDEFIAICEAFAKKTEDKHAILAYYKEQARICLPFALKNAIKSTNSAQIFANLNEGIASEEVYAGLIELYNSFKEKGYFNSANGNLANNYNDCIVEFFKGNVPFLFGTTGTFSGCAKREAADKSSYQEHPFKYSFIAIPNGEKNASYVVTNTNAMFSICNTSKNLDYATEFLKFLLLTENMNTISLKKGMPSTNVKVVNSNFSSMSKLNQDNVYSIVSVNISATAYNKLRDSLDGLRSSEVTVESLIESFKNKMGK